MTIILDAAHGEETPGKRSPDGRFREYKWSRKIIDLLINDLRSENYEVFESNATDREIGLTKRAENTNKIVRNKKIFISLHSNAAGNGINWANARGYSVYTTKGQNNSDKIAEIIMKQFKLDFPELKERSDKSDGDLDIEENFTVITKTNCPSVLIEWLFQDNKDDVELLLNDEVNNKLIKSLIKSIKIIETII